MSKDGADAGLRAVLMARLALVRGDAGYDDDGDADDEKRCRRSQPRMARKTRGRDGDGHSDHGAGVHDPVAEGVRVVPAHGVHPPVRGSAARRSQHQQVGK